MHTNSQLQAFSLSLIALVQFQTKQGIVQGANALSCAATAERNKRINYGNLIKVINKINIWRKRAVSKQSQSVCRVDERMCVCVGKWLLVDVLHKFLLTIRIHAGGAQQKRSLFFVVLSSCVSPFVILYYYSFLFFPSAFSLTFGLWHWRASALIKLASNLSSATPSYRLASR